MLPFFVSHVLTWITNQNGFLSYQSQSGSVFLLVLSWKNGSELAWHNDSFPSEDWFGSRCQMEQTKSHCILYLAGVTLLLMLRVCYEAPVLSGCGELPGGW